MSSSPDSMGSEYVLSCSEDEEQQQPIVEFKEGRRQEDIVEVTGTGINAHWDVSKVHRAL